MENLSEQIVSRAIAFQTEQLPDSAVHAVKRCLLDYCGVVLEGARQNRERNLSYLRASGACGSVSIFGMDCKADLYTAALLNGMDAHTIELDDGHRFGMLHMGAPIFSALLAAADGRSIPGEALLKAAVCGYEIAIALARQMQPGHKLKGYHATGTCCTVGCAMAAGTLLGLDAPQLRGALAAAATSAAGLLEVIDDASQLKPYNIGRAAMDGLAAAFTGAAGYCGPDDVIGGKRGFFAALAQPEDYQRIRESTLFPEDDGYAIEAIYFKPYAACRHCHPAIEAGLTLRERLKQMGGTTDDVDGITVRTYRLAIGGHDHTAVSGASSAKMSTPYALAAALCTGLAGIAAYQDDLLTDARIGALMQRIRLVMDPELDRLNPQKRAAVVELRLRDGRSLDCRVDYPRGEPENPIPDSELEAKFFELAASGGYGDRAEQILTCVRAYEERASELYGLLR